MYSKSLVAFKSLGLFISGSIKQGINEIIFQTKLCFMSNFSLEQRSRATLNHPSLKYLVFLLFLFNKRKSFTSFYKNVTIMWNLIKNLIPK